ncbi:MAG: hypothetical protein GY950_20845, partial [bacterium]|nr:hypothetical protein [bacterium]
DFDFEGAFRFIPLRSKEGHYALISADKLYLLSESKVSFAQTVEGWVNSGLLFTIIFLLLFNLFFIYCMYRWGVPFPPFSQGSQSAVMETAELYEIVRAIVHQSKNPISTVLWTAEKIKRDSAEQIEPGAAETYNQLADVLMENVDTLQRQTRQIVELVEAHGNKKPGTKIALDIETKQEAGCEK